MSVDPMVVPAPGGAEDSRKQLVAPFAGGTPRYPRTLLVRAEAGRTELGAFVAAMEERLGARFRSVLEYAFR